MKSGSAPVCGRTALKLTYDSCPIHPAESAIPTPAATSRRRGAQRGVSFSSMQPAGRSWLVCTSHRAIVLSACAASSSRRRGALNAGMHTARDRRPTRAASRRRRPATSARTAPPGAGGCRAKARTAPAFVRAPPRTIRRKLPSRYRRDRLRLWWSARGTAGRGSARGDEAGRCAVLEARDRDRRASATSGAGAAIGARRSGRSVIDIPDERNVDNPAEDPVLADVQGRLRRNKEAIVASLRFVDVALKDELSTRAPARWPSTRQAALTPGAQPWTNVVHRHAAGAKPKATQRALEEMLDACLPRGLCTNAAPVVHKVSAGADRWIEGGPPGGTVRRRRHARSSTVHRSSTPAVVGARVQPALSIARAGIQAVIKLLRFRSAFWGGAAGARRGASFPRGRPQPFRCSWTQAETAPTARDAAARRSARRRDASGEAGVPSLFGKRGMSPTARSAGSATRGLWLRRRRGDPRATWPRTGGTLFFGGRRWLRQGHAS